MKNKSFIFLCFCALLLISLVAFDPSKEEKQFGEIEKSNNGNKNIGSGIPFTESVGGSANDPLFLDCEKDGGGGNGDCDGEEGGGVKEGDRKKEGCNGKHPVRHYPDIGMGHGCITIHNNGKKG
ncbi:uncharacterized protein LOC131617679 [Vicia villosa]|uniref:uncharacterized protein LOC131617679 n=1 Tax=Vicia villosa TaxID=3911 RepID=UPI00273C4A96|nr:uncharacterized protein LOC131617679 [Vicia villosa]